MEDAGKSATRGEVHCGMCVAPGLESRRGELRRAVCVCVLQC